MNTFEICKSLKVFYGYACGYSAALHVLRRLSPIHLHGVKMLSPWQQQGDGNGLHLPGCSSWSTSPLMNT